MTYRCFVSSPILSAFRLLSLHARLFHLINCNVKHCDSFKLQYFKTSILNRFFCEIILWWLFCGKYWHFLSKCRKFAARKSSAPNNGKKPLERNYQANNAKIVLLMFSFTKDLHFKIWSESFPIISAWILYFKHSVNIAWSLTTKSNNIGQKKLMN